MPIWMGFVLLRHKQEWVLMFWSVMYLKKKDDPLSPKALGIDSKAIFYKTLLINRVPIRIRHAVASAEGQKLLNSPETRRMRLAMMFVGWMSLVAPILTLLRPLLFSANR